MRALVTGAAGFVGSTLTDRLLADGHQVVGVDNLSTGRLGNLESAIRRYALRSRQFTFIEVDVQAPELTGIVAGASPDVVFHLAAHTNPRASVSDPLYDARCNVLGTINVCEASRRASVRRLIYAASGGTRYGASTASPVSEVTEAAPGSPYAAAKVAGELYVRAYGEMYEIKTTCLALASVYGPRQELDGESAVIAVFSNAMLTGVPVTAYGSSTAVHDYIYVDDVVDAFIRVGRRSSTPSDFYNIGTGRRWTVNDVQRHVSAILGHPTTPVYEAMRAGEPHAVALDVRKAETELEWRPAVDLAEGLRRTSQWMRDFRTPLPDGMSEAS
jgi:UDP-glucose 4-epimerase